MRARYIILLIAIALILSFITGVISAGYLLTLLATESGTTSYSHVSRSPSSGIYEGEVTRIIDGDTLDVDGTRIRLSLVNCPERGQSGYSEARDFTSDLCPVGSTAQVDVDDGQPTDTYGRTVAVVYCGGENLNAELYRHGLARIYERFLSVSEFDPEKW